MSTASIRRVAKELKDLANKPIREFTLVPLESNMLEVHFTMTGPEDSPYANGLYHGYVVVPAEYPFAPPDVVLLTPNGRFETGKKVCLSVSSYHPEHWKATWGIATILHSLRTFMLTAGTSGIAAINYPAEKRRELAAESRSFVCKRCGSCVAEQWDEIMKDAPPATDTDKGELLPPMPPTPAVAPATPSASSVDQSQSAVSASAAPTPISAAAVGSATPAAANPLSSTSAAAALQSPLMLPSAAAAASSSAAAAAAPPAFHLRSGDDNNDGENHVASSEFYSIAGRGTANNTNNNNNNNPLHATNGGGMGGLMPQASSTSFMEQQQPMGLTPTASAVMGGEMLTGMGSNAYSSASFAPPTSGAVTDSRGGVAGGMGLTSEAPVTVVVPPSGGGAGAGTNINECENGKGTADLPTTCANTAASAVGSAVVGRRVEAAAAATPPASNDDNSDSSMTVMGPPPTVSAAAAAASSGAALQSVVTAAASPAVVPTSESSHASSMHPSASGVGSNSSNEAVGAVPPPTDGDAFPEAAAPAEQQQPEPAAIEEEAAAEQPPPQQQQQMPPPPVQRRRGGALEFEINVKDIDRALFFTISLFVLMVLKKMAFDWPSREVAAAFAERVAAFVAKFVRFVAGGDNPDEDAWMMIG